MSLEGSKDDLDDDGQMMMMIILELIYILYSLFFIRAMKINSSSFEKETHQSCFVFSNAIYSSGQHAVYHDMGYLID